MNWLLASSLGFLILASALIRWLRGRVSFRDKVIIITGGSRGLGLMIAKTFSRERVKLVLLARDEKELAKAKAELEACGAEVLTLPCDLTDRAQIVSAVDRVVSHFHRVDVLVNNAGIIEVGPFAHMTREDFERSLALHFWAPFDLVARVRQLMRAQGGGRIVNISSIGGKMAVPHLAPYVVGKFALTGFSDATRAELARENIRVTTVAPGMMRTGSDVHARFKGDHSAEFKWFSVSNKMPLTSMSAERAARKIVAACKRGQPSLTLTFAARIGIIASALCPNLFAYAMKLTIHFLPQPIGPEGDELKCGDEIQR
ncbi:MAG: SDR family oxidoreductase [Verrucomicrobiota bacterium]|nr:SDR family oxidoreductase [Verrucomicrobiota bacterium]